ncbi:MAG: rhodanese-like domain-containing protein [Candidatus Micrarchaeia archaeon]|jgi:rhodanese-related sulfurtransferase
MKSEYNFLVFCVLASVAASLLLSYAVFKPAAKSGAEMIADYYTTAQLVEVSPHDYLVNLEKGKVDGLAVDLRSAGEYKALHMASAVNVPAGGMTEEQLVAAFSQLQKDHPGVPLITYCYSSYCMLARKVGKTLADNGIYTKHFTAGWYEIKRDFEPYLVNGTAAGAVKLTAAESASGACPKPVAGSPFAC